MLKHESDPHLRWGVSVFPKFPEQVVHGCPWLSSTLRSPLATPILQAILNLDYVIHGYTWYTDGILVA